MYVGNGIASLREEKKLSQAKLAELIGISRPQLSLIENGHAIADYELVRKLAEALDCTAGDIYRPALLKMIRGGR